MQNNELKKSRIKNRTCYYFDDIFKVEDFDLDNILIYEKFGSKPLRIRFDKIDGIMRIYDRNRYLTFFGPKKCDAIYDKIGYLINIKSGITYTISHYFAKIKVDSYNFLPTEKRWLCFLNEDKDHYY